MENKVNYLAYANKCLGNRTVESVRQSMSLRNDRIDQVHFGCHPLEEHVTSSGVIVGFNIDLRQIWLCCSVSQRELGLRGNKIETCIISNISLCSLASHFASSRSILLAWFLEADDCNLRLSDIIAAVWEAALSDSDCADCVWARRLSRSLKGKRKSI